MIVPHEPKWWHRLIAWLVYVLVQAVWLTTRKRWDDRSGLATMPKPGPAIFCVWHNRLAFCLPGYEARAHTFTKTPGMAAMCSASKDGAFLAGILEQFRVQPVRGSSSRRGPQALLELTTWAERGYDLAITPDGPRGPRYVVQEGIMALAQITGLPIIPSSYYLSRKIRIKSWDNFQIPLPFSRVEITLEKPVQVPREVSGAEREQIRLQLERTLRDITRD